MWQLLKLWFFGVYITSMLFRFSMSLLVNFNLKPLSADVGGPLMYSDIDYFVYLELCCHILHGKNKSDDYQTMFEAGK